MRYINTIFSLIIIISTVSSLGSTIEYKKTDFITLLGGVGSRENYYQIAK